MLVADTTSWSLRPPWDVPVVGGGSDERGFGSQDLCFFTERFFYPGELELYKNYNHLFVHVYVCHVHAHMCHGMYLGTRGQSLEVGSLLPFYGSWGSNSGVKRQLCPPINFSGPQRASVYLLKNISK